MTEDWRTALWVLGGFTAILGSLLNRGWAVVGGILLMWLMVSIGIMRGYRGR